MSAVTEHLRPAACPECDARLNTPDRVVLQFQRLAAVASLAKGRSPSRSGNLRTCDGCGKPNGARKAH